MKSFFKKVSDVKSSISKFVGKNRQTIKFIFRDNIKNGFLNKLKNEEFLVSQDSIEHHVDEALKNEPDIELESVYCTPEGVHVLVFVRKYKAKVKVNFCMSIRKMKLTKQHQFVIFQFHNQKIKGANFTGLLAAIVVESILEGIIAKSIFPEEILRSIHYRKDHTAAIVQLRDLDIVKSLKKPILGTEKSTFDFISVIGAYHNYAGIVVKVKAFSFLRK